MKVKSILIGVLLLGSVLVLGACADEIYEVTFHDGDEVLETVEVTEGETIDPVEEPEKDHYAFQGWYPDPDGEEAHNFEEPVGKNLDLYARFEPLAYTISFDGHGGSEVDSIEALYGTDIEAPEDPERKGYVFEGWYEDEAYEERFAFNEMPGADLTLHARWEPDLFMIDFESHGGSAVDLIEAPYQSEIEAPKDPEKEGCIFKGWYEDEEDNVPFGFDKMPAKDMTLHAKWEAEEFVIDFETHGGSAVEPIVADYGDEIEAPEDPEKEGHSFAGWYKDADFEEAYVFTTMPNEDLTLHAKWVVASYTIAFETHGGTAIDEMVLAYGDEIELPDDPTRENHEFTGWYLDATYAEPFELTTMPAEDITLHAKWEEVLPYEGVFAIDLENLGMPLVFYMKIDDDSRFTLAADDAFEDVRDAGEVVEIEENGDTLYKMIYDEEGKYAQFELENGNLRFVTDLPYGEANIMHVCPEGEHHLTAKPIDES